MSWCGSVFVGAVALLVTLACRSAGPPDDAQPGPTLPAQHGTSVVAASQPTGQNQPTATTAPAAKQEPPSSRPGAPGAAAPTATAPADSARFAENAFPPPLPDTANHRDAWVIENCRRCHETGVGDAPMLMHRTVPDVARTAKCRTCHVLIPGLPPRPRVALPEEELFLRDAFPPMIPASSSHMDAWLNDSCLLCHQAGVRGAPIVKHAGMSDVLLTAKCRSCHVQVRSVLVPGR